jgi:HAE1 family hydrophobic/amphiphilic exporter-1
MSRFFIRRPTVAIVIAIITVLGGLAAMRALPIAQFPEIVPPQITVTATYNGADALTMAQAQPNLPPDVNTFGLTMRKATGFPMLIVSLSSPRDTYDALFLANYANINMTDALYRVPGVGEVRLFGASDYAMRIWVKPDRLAQLGLTVPELMRAVQQQSTVNPSGRIGAQPVPSGQEFSYTVRAQGRLQTAEEFGGIAVRSNPDGSVVRLSDVARIELGALNYGQIGRVNGKPGCGVAPACWPRRCSPSSSSRCCPLEEKA